jgi:hypothetical protein
MMPDNHRLPQTTTDRDSKLLRTLAVVVCVSLSQSGVLFAQGSIFAVRGLGWSARAVSARTGATGGAMAMFDPTMNLNPAALTRWRSVAAWAVGVPTRRSYTSPTVSADQETTRFPLFGFASVIPSRAAISFSISDFLDRTWTLTETDSLLLRGQMEKFTDAGRSIGGVSDLSLAAGYRVTNSFSVGLGFHYYLGSTRLTAQRLYTNTSYQEIIEQSQTDFRGAGIGAGVMWTLPRIDIAASARLNGRLRSHNTSGQVAHTKLPTQLAFGFRWQAVPGVFLAGTAQYEGWKSAEATLGTGVSRDVWGVAAGAEVLSATILGIRTPLRLGYRTRTLPFTTQGQSISERAMSGGVGFNLARERTTVDLGVESGSRKAGAARETFQSVFVGLTVRP